MSKKVQGGGVLGISGFARTGKDTLCQLLLKRMNENSKRVALADALKNEMSPVLRNYFDKDVWTQDSKEKELLRPLMVAWGGIRRRESKGTHWTNIATIEIQKIVEAGGWAIVTDIRYANPDYPSDEVFWLKSLGGTLVHLKKYEQFQTFTGPMEEPTGWIDCGRSYVEAPNVDEAENDVKLQELADYKIEWRDVGTSLHLLEDHIDSLVDYLNEYKRSK